MRKNNKRDYTIARTAKSKTESKTSFSSLLCHPVLLVILIMGFIVGIHSFNFSEFRFHAPDHKAIGAMVIFAIGFGFVIVFTAGQTGPLLLAELGYTNMAEKLATAWAKHMGLMWSTSLDYPEALMNLSLICRMNGKYQKAVQTCEKALKALEKRDKFMANLPEPKNDRAEMIRQVNESTEKDYLYLRPDIKRFMAWTLYDLGKLEESKRICGSALKDIDLALEKLETMAQSEKEDKPKENILTRDLLLESANSVSSYKKRTQRIIRVQASILELLGTITSFEGDATKVQTYFDYAYSAREEHDKDSLYVWRLNMGFAELNLDNPGSAKEHLEACLRESEEKNWDARLKASLYNNLGETYRRLKMKDLAKKYLEQSVEIKEKLYPANHIELLETYQNLSKFHQDNGNRSSYKKYLDLVNRSPMKKLAYKNPVLSKGANPRYSSSSI